MYSKNYDQLQVAAQQNRKERNYWLEKLADAAGGSRFPYRYMEPGAQPGERVNFEYSSFEYSFSGDVVSGADKLSTGSATKLHMILTAGLVLLLHKYTGNDDILVGVPIYKQETEIDFVNTFLVLRNNVAEAEGFKGLLLDVRKSIVAAVENQNYPVEILVEQLGKPFLEHDVFPLSDVIILHEDIHDKKHIRHINNTILFSFSGNGNKLTVTVDYESRYYREEDIRLILQHYENLLRQVFSDVRSPIDSIDLISVEERQWILNDLNGTDADYPSGGHLHEFFSQQATATPDGVAVTAPGGKDNMEADLLSFGYPGVLTYGSLEKESRRLAGILEAKGIGAGDIVAVLVERSLDTFVTIFGILKTGAAYLPIDTRWPGERIDFILTDSNASLLITTQALAGSWAFKEKILLIDGEEFRESPVQDKKQAESSVCPSQSPAYVIYTSGTTGKPKGVLVEHRNVMAYVYAFYREFEITKRDILLQQASFAFDVFVEEVYPVLLRGGQIVVAGMDTVLEMGSLEKLIRRSNITLISCSPLMLSQLNALPVFETVHTYINGGDTLKTEYVNNLLKNAAVYNTYGPTETTVCATYYRCGTGGAGNGPEPPIGKPIGNYRVFILANTDELLPVGVPGQLCIAGDGVARGYLNRPQLTVVKFGNGE
ncbi:MAG: AMP-binding protein [bacterium]|nr:AMP-binding protein [bacterium]